MKQYGTITALNSYNVGFLAGLRSSLKQKPVPTGELSEEEPEAWLDGFADGRAMRRSFELPVPVAARKGDLAYSERE